MGRWDHETMGLWGDGAFLSVSDMKRWGGQAKADKILISAQKR